jgi:hypothetical protein
MKCSDVLSVCYVRKHVSIDASTRQSTRRDIILLTGPLSLRSFCPNSGGTKYDTSFQKEPSTHASSVQTLLWQRGACRSACRHAFEHDTIPWTDHFHHLQTDYHDGSSPSFHPCPNYSALRHNDHPTCSNTSLLDHQSRM